MKRNLGSALAVGAAVAISAALMVSTTSAQTSTPIPTATTAGAGTATAMATEVSTMTPVPTLTTTLTTTPPPTPGVTPVPTGTLTADTVTVDGTGQASIAPDTAVIELGVQNRAISASAALSQTNVQAGALISALVAAGVQRADIQTLSVNLFPVYTPSQTQGAPPTLTGFNASNVVRVRAHDVSMVGSLLDTAVGAGANTIQGVRFEVSDPVDAQSRARADALTNARQKAEQLALLAGRTLGRIRAVVESSSPGQTIPFALAAGGRGGANTVPIEPGAQNVQITVQVTWELR